MAGHASRAGQVVVIVDVAIGAGARWHRVQPRQSKTGGGVVELAIGPHHGVVALLARRGESVVRHRRGRVVVVRLVAADAGRIRNVVVVVNVTISTLARRHHMRTGQWESRLRVIEGCRLPTRGVVTNVASLRKSAGDMVGTRSALEVLQVAGHAGRAGQVVVIVDVAVGAGSRWHRMQAGQRETGGVVIKRGIQPGARAMALLAGLREIRADVIRIGRALKVL